MTFARFGTFPAASVLALMCALSAKADEIEVQFSGVLTNTGGAPGMSVGESFSGDFSYSTADPLDVSIGGQSTYSLTSPEDSESVSVGSFSLLLQPLTGVHAFVSPGGEYFLTQDFVAPGTAGISISFNGGPGFLPSEALPDPLNTSEITSGSISFTFSEDSVDYAVDGNISQVSTVPEPRGLGWICFAPVSLVVMLRRRFIASRS
jgi:hypothetical protein